MMTRERRENQIALVLLEGIKVAVEKTGIAPLCRAVRSVVNPDDEILVLVILHARSSEPPPSSSSFDGTHQWNVSCEADPYISFLHKEIAEKKEVYMQIFTPFYRGCKNKGVKFQVKIAAGFRLKEVLIEEANNVKATWIVMDSCFARQMSFQLSGTDCNVSLVSDDEESEVNCDLTHINEGLESIIFREIDDNPQSPKLMKGSIPETGCHNSPPSAKIEDQPCSPSPRATVEKESNNQDASKPYEETEIPRQARRPLVSEISQGTISSEVKNYCNTANSSKAKFLSSTSRSIASCLLRQPLQLSWEVIVEITQGFKSSILVRQERNYLSYYGYLEDYQSIVLVKRFRGEWGSILEAERKAALSLHHKNILRLTAYHRNENDTILVFPFGMGRTLDKYIHDSRCQWKLEFEDKMKIALGTAKGLRYMHEECPRGPIVHGEVQPNNIFLSSGFEPMISGFGNATWLQVDQEPALPDHRCPLKDYFDQRSMALIQSDILSFGILLLRLFCKKALPEDDKILVGVARPLLLEKAFHLLLDEDSDDIDVHAIYRVMSAATLCTNPKLASRPCMSEVIAILKGENFCPAQSSPSDNSWSREEFDASPLETH
ncbi:hypothetical protein Tsubulata_027774, partial [Turnera subulata]